MLPNSHPAGSAVAPGGEIKIEQQAETITLRLSNPGKLNAISVKMWRELAEFFRTLPERSGARCVILEGEGGNFAAGADIEEFPVERADLDSVMRYHEEILAPALLAIAECPLVTIAAIQGVCVGGGLEISSQCDLRIAAESSRFGVPINQLGFPMAPTELRGLLQLAGPVVAREILLEGRVFSAVEAFHKGLLTRMVPDAEFAEAIRATIHQVLRGSAQAARWNKVMIRRLAPQSPVLPLQELRAFYASWCDSHEHREGVRAFLEKRKPNF